MRLLGAVSEGSGAVNEDGFGWLGRADQTAKVRGMFIHPEQVDKVIKRHAEIKRARLVVDWVEQADRMTFPYRNRIISGMALGVVVIEAALPSGSLITAGAALEQGREVFALPWSPLHEGGLGCLQLLRDGAKMVRAVDDILEEFDVGDVPRGVSFQTAREKGREESWLLPLLG